MSGICSAWLTLIMIVAFVGSGVSSLVTTAEGTGDDDGQESNNAFTNTGIDDITDNNYDDAVTELQSYDPTIQQQPPGNITSGETTTTTCSANYECFTDRLGQNDRLKSGQAICSRDDRYMFGMENGTLLWKDCTMENADVKQYYPMESDDDVGGSTMVDNAVGDYFVMDETATFIIYGSDGRIKWTWESNASIQKYDTCLSEPELDCPYLHLHKDGVVVLNYIDGSGGWTSKNIKAMYDF